MKLRTVACAAGLLGGACWVVRAVLDRGGDEAGLVEPLYWAGLGLLFLALLGFGMGLVKKSAVWLRMIVGVAFPALVWSVVEVVHRAGDAVVVDAVAGVAIAVVALVTWARHRRDRAETKRRHAGSHAR